MGVRCTTRIFGRFNATDPIEGGSANSCDYLSGDAINRTRLSGECWFCFDTLGQDKMCLADVPE